MKIFPNFQIAALRAAQEMLEQSYRVHSGRWQGMDISSRPEAEMHEMLNWVFQVPLNGKERLTHYQEDIEPNLPWADDHFAERVGGKPLNPGEQWRNWPWANKADDSRVVPELKRFTPSEWGYLAGLIDGDGCINVRTNTGQLHPNPRITITQKDHDYLRSVQQLFEFGTLTSRERSITKYTGEVITAEPLVWRISAREEVRCVINGVLPYLRLKREQAIEALSVLPEVDRRRKETHDLSEEHFKFSHSYMERFWSGSVHGRKLMGIRYPYGDLNDLVNHLAEDPLSRQAYLPIWYPEDGACPGRKPCTLGYWFIARNGYFHMHYPIRSCDIVRHFRDDCYMGVRLLLWILDRLREKSPETWTSVRPGMYTMWIGSFHCFLNDHTILRKWLGR